MLGTDALEFVATLGRVRVERFRTLCKTLRNVQRLVPYSSKQPILTSAPAFQWFADWDEMDGGELVKFRLQVQEVDQWLEVAGSYAGSVGPPSLLEWKPPGWWVDWRSDDGTHENYGQVDWRNRFVEERGYWTE